MNKGTYKLGVFVFVERHTGRGTRIAFIQSDNIQLNWALNNTVWNECDLAEVSFGLIGGTYEQTCELKARIEERLIEYAAIHNFNSIEEYLESVLKQVESMA